jgi:hypothetical protein
MSVKALSYALPVAIELAGIFILIIGIAVEISTRAELGHYIMSVGSCLIAVGSVIWSKIFKLKAKERNSK